MVSVRELTITILTPDFHHMMRIVDVVMLEVAKVPPASVEIEISSAEEWKQPNDNH